MSITRSNSTEPVSHSSSQHAFAHCQMPLAGDSQSEGKVMGQICVIVDILASIQFPVHTALVGVWQHSPAAAALRMEHSRLETDWKVGFWLVRLWTRTKVVDGAGAAPRRLVW